MKYTSQNCCDKTMDDKMALNRERCFPTSCTQSWRAKLLLCVGGGNRPSKSAPDPLCLGLHPICSAQLI